MCETAVYGYRDIRVHFYREIDAYLYNFRGKVELSPAWGCGKEAYFITLETHDILSELLS